MEDALSKNVWKVASRQSSASILLSRRSINAKVLWFHARRKIKNVADCHLHEYVESLPS